MVFIMMIMGHDRTPTCILTALVRVQYIYACAQAHCNICSCDKPQDKTPTEHLQVILEDRPLSAANMQGIMEKNKQRYIIRSMFSQRSCHVLPHPGCDTKVMEGLPDSQLSEDFVTVSMLMSKQLMHQLPAGA